MSLVFRTLFNERARSQCTMGAPLSPSPSSSPSLAGLVSLGRFGPPAGAQPPLVRSRDASLWLPPNRFNSIFGSLLGFTRAGVGGGGRERERERRKRKPEHVRCGCKKEKAQNRQNLILSQHECSAGPGHTRALFKIPKNSSDAPPLFSTSLSILFA